MKANVEQAVKEYFTDLAREWADLEDHLIIRISRVESRILNVEGILDVTGTKINGKPENLVLPIDTIPVIGNLTASTATIVAG